MVMSEDEKKLTACHEGGHAIVALNEQASDPIISYNYTKRESFRYGYEIT